MVGEALGNQQVIEAVLQFGSPLFLYDGSILRDTYRSLREALPNEIDIFYSMKANPVLGISELLCREGACCEVCSAVELEVAIKAGFKPSDIIFVGPGKSADEIEQCFQHQIYAIVCESIEEVEQINRMAKARRTTFPILLRVNPDFSIQNAPLKMGGKATQFGMDFDIVNALNPSRFENIKILGIHVYNGTRILDADSVIANTVNVLSLAETFAKKWGLLFECVDIGGGLGIPYFPGENIFNLQKFKSGMALVIKQYIEKYPNTRIILESGRYLVGPCGSLISKVLSVKPSHGEDFIITDGGMNCHMAVTGIGSFIKRNFPTQLISPKTTNLKLRKYNVTGPLCTPGDVTAKQVELPEAHIGDLIKICASGAYGPTASPGRFLSHGFPAEVLFDENKFYLLRRRETVEDILSTQCSLSNMLTNKEILNEKH